MTRILTKSEFREEFEYKDLSSVSHLIRKGTIVVEDDGTIDIEKGKNKKWAKARLEKINKKGVTKTEEAPKNKPPAKPKKNEDQLSLEIELLNQRLDEKKKKSTLLDLQIAKEKKEVVETDVLNRVIITSFNSLFQNLSELPSIYVEDLISIVKTNKKPKEALVKFLTDKIISHIQSSLEVAENLTKKHYE